MADIAKQRTITTSFTERMTALNEMDLSHHSIFRLEELGADLIREIIYLGNSAEEIPDEERSIEQYILLFEWMEEAKNFALLWRNVMLEIQKAIIISIDDPQISAKLALLNKRSLEQLRLALFELHNFYNEIKSNVSDAEKQISAYQKLINPWPLYKEQFLRIKTQLTDIRLQFVKMFPFGEQVRDVKTDIRSFIGSYEKGVDELIKYLHRTINFLSNDAPLAEKQLTEFFRDVQDDISDHYRSFNVEEYFRQTDSRRQRIMIQAHNGEIVYKESAIHRNTIQWLEAEIAPKLYSSLQQLRAAKDSLQIALMNAQNRVLTQSQTNEQLFGSNFKEPFIQVKDKIESVAALIHEEKNALDLLLSNDFTLKSIYNDDYSFLTPSLQESVTQFTLRPNNLLERLQLQWQKMRHSFNNYKQSVYQEEQMGITERMCRYLEEKGPLPGAETYVQTFLTKGFIGESFMAGRSREAKQVEKVIDQWNTGFRGSIAITGWRHSGKSFFGDYVAKNFFGRNTIYLRPNEEINVYNRKIKAGYDLDEVLQFIKTYTLNYRPLLWIDDLELWHNKEYPVFENARELCDFIDGNYSRIFVMVGMSNSLYNHLINLGHPLPEIFHSTINMDNMENHAVKKAVMIRHGATHTELLDKTNKEIERPILHRMINKLHQRFHGNIGDILMQWANNIKSTGPNTVSIGQKYQYAFPDIVKGEMAVILSVVHMFKSINEYDIRQILGPSFNQSYANIIRRLISMQVLKRDINNALSINDLLVNQIGMQLEEKGLLQYTSKTTALYD